MERDDLIATLHAALSAQPGVRAAWIAGSEAFGRVDAYSDVDCLAIAEDEGVEAVFAAVEAALHAISPLTWRYRMPMPTWHGHAQAILQLQGAGEYRFIDLVVMARSHPERFLEVERHGQPRILFDREGLIRPSAIAPAAWQDRIDNHVAAIRSLQPLYQTLLRKAVLRGNGMEALQLFQTRTFLPLVALLRIKHCPWRYDFGVRYLKDDLPADTTAKLEALAFVSDLDHLAAQNEIAVAWMATLLAERAQP